jgi:UDPglucose 6-dehydrogenase
VTVFDPKVSTLPGPLSSAVAIASSVDAVFANSEAVVLATEWPAFRELNFAALVPSMKRALLIDQNAFVAKQLADTPGFEYIVAGKVR